MSVQESHFHDEGNKIMNNSQRLGTKAAEQRFRSHFGTSPAICAILWQMIETVPGGKPKHLLWGLMLLKLYCAERVLRTLAGGVDERTFRKWAWTYVYEVSDLQYRVVRCVSLGAPHGC